MASTLLPSFPWYYSASLFPPELDSCKRPCRGPGSSPQMRQPLSSQVGRARSRRHSRRSLDSGLPGCPHFWEDSAFRLCFEPTPRRRNAFEGCWLSRRRRTPNRCRDRRPGSLDYERLMVDVCQYPSCSLLFDRRLFGSPPGGEDPAEGAPPPGHREAVHQKAATTATRSCFSHPSCSRTRPSRSFTSLAMSRRSSFPNSPIAAAGSTAQTTVRPSSVS